MDVLKIKKELKCILNIFFEIFDFEKKSESYMLFY